MKKTDEPAARVTPDQALEFLENFRKMQAGIEDGKTLVSIRVPNNILNAFRLLAKSEDRPYQRMMIQALREYLSKK